jgi:hypothetical protein
MYCPVLGSLSSSVGGSWVKKCLSLIFSAGLSVINCRMCYIDMHAQGGGHDISERDSGRVAPEGERSQVQHSHVSCLRQPQGTPQTVLLRQGTH